MTKPLTQHERAILRGVAELWRESERVDELTKSLPPELRPPDDNEVQLWYLKQLELSLRYKQAYVDGDFSDWRYDWKSKVLTLPE